MSRVRIDVIEKRTGTVVESVYCGHSDPDQLYARMMTKLSEDFRLQKTDLSGVTHLYYVSAKNDNGVDDASMFVEAVDRDDALRLWKEGVAEFMDTEDLSDAQPKVFLLPEKCGTSKALPWHKHNGVNIVEAPKN